MGRIDTRIDVCNDPHVAKPSMEVNISFRVRRALRDAARAKAEERQESVSDVLRQALELYVEPTTNQQGES